MDPLLTVFTAGVGVILLLAFVFTRRDGRISATLSGVKGPKGVPILGNALSFLRPNHELVALILTWYREYGSPFKVWIANTPIIVLSAANDVEKILASTTHIEKGEQYGLLHPWLGLGLLTAGAGKWHRRRKLLTPTFHFKILEEFMPIFNDQADVFVGILRKDRGQDRKPFDIFPYVTRCALDIICETAMGKKLNAQLTRGEGDNGKYVSTVYEYGALLVKKFLMPWQQNPWVWKVLGGESTEVKIVATLHKFTNEVIAERKGGRKRQGPSSSSPLGQEEDDVFSEKKRKAFLDLLLDLADQKGENGEPLLTDEEIREETDTFMFEGHDTTAANMVWTILCLSAYPECQKRLQEELDSVFGSSSSFQDFGAIGATELSKMKYLEACVKESLRLYPSVPYYLRQLTSELTLSPTLTIPPGVNVGVAAHCLHRDPTVFPDPETFNPGRFLDVGGDKRSPFAYVPFSAGPRNCIGQKFALLEEKVVLSKLFFNFHFELDGRIQDVKCVPDIILRPLEGVRVSISPRKRSNK